MDSSRIDLILKYALAAASREEWGRRELGLIHLLKYVYLGDLAHAEKHGGETYTGAPWRFHKFGPWTEPVYERIPIVLTDVGAIERRAESPRTPEDLLRWSVDAPDLFEELDRDLPFVVASAVKRAIHEFSDDTGALLEYVYRTPPMLRAAPGERLDFAAAVRQPFEPAAPSHEATAPPTRRQEKKRAERMAAARERVRAAFETRKGARLYVEPVPAPRYDAVYDDGVEWLDDLAGEQIEARGELNFDDSIWKSAARGDAETP